MISTELQQEVRFFRPALSLNRSFGRGLRRVLRKISIFLLILFIVLEIILQAIAQISTLVEPVSFLAVFVDNAPTIRGLLFITLATSFIFLMIESFFNSRYLKGVASSTRVAKGRSAQGITYEVADVLEFSYSDLTASFCTSIYGRTILARCNIFDDAISGFLSGNRTKITPKVLILPKHGFLSLSELADTIFKADKDFANFLFSNGVNDTMYKGSTEWVSRSLFENKFKEAWWLEDNLLHTEGIGKDWAYGGAYLLSRFAKDPSAGSVFSSLSTENNYASEKVKQLETILARDKEANALLIGDQGVGKRDIIVLLEQKILHKETIGVLENRRVLDFDTNAFLAAYGEKNLFEQALLKLLEQTKNAGNIILIIDDMPVFIKSAESLGSDVTALMDSYLSSRDMQVIATSDPVSYHEIIEARPQLMQRFESVQIESPDFSSTIRILERVAEEYERKNRVVFTYAAIQTIIEGADRYIVGGVMPDKAVDLLVEVVPVALSESQKNITKDVVEAYITKKTDIPVGKITKKEQNTLLHLEEILHKRVVGQEEAVEIISNAMRRARAGIQSPDRPMGSFLFLGPTGVGKTETTKALAEVFFGDEDNMLRLDMSEYSSDDALERLIGSREQNSVGALVTLLKEHPHGVLLLDEFEKTTPSVMDLFLQVLDEGSFTSSRGETISARNLVIIATSNAGSDIIWKYTKEGRKVHEAKDEIIDAIIKKGIYKPELINRFDGVVLFHTLKEEHLESIAQLMLESLKKRIKKQGFELVVNDVLVSILVQRGFDPKFGARPMRRVLQEEIGRAHV